MAARAENNVHPLGLTVYLRVRFIGVGVTSADLLRFDGVVEDVSLIIWRWGVGAGVAVVTVVPICCGPLDCFGRIVDSCIRRKQETVALAMVAKV